MYPTQLGRCHVAALKLARSAIVAATFAAGTTSAIAQDKPNILVIWGDDIGVHIISAYNVRAGAFYNVEKPSDAPDWYAKFTVQFLFPK